VIAKPTSGISTPAAYKYLDDKYSGFVSHNAVDSKNIIEAISTGNYHNLSENLFNRFELAADELCPQSKELRLFMQKYSYNNTTKTLVINNVNKALKPIIPKTTVHKISFLFIFISPLFYFTLLFY
ncbi:MAG: hypothetical protein II196_07530, partial [Spirochaetales bacterium]|nr:hypothetical protein [Spirochaetales bacterium]